MMPERHSSKASAHAPAAFGHEARLQNVGAGLRLTFCARSTDSSTGFDEILARLANFER